jgi:hypothetical protein
MFNEIFAAVGLSTYVSDAHGFAITSSEIFVHSSCPRMVMNNGEAAL